MGECQTEDLEVAGSSPARGTSGDDLTRKALQEKKRKETEKKAKMILFMRFSQLTATILMVLGILILIVILYLKYYS